MNNNYKNNIFEFFQELKANKKVQKSKHSCCFP